MYLWRKRALLAEVGHALLISMLFAGCGAPEAALGPRVDGAAAALLEVRDLPPVEMEWSGAVAPHGEALEEALRAADGYALVRLKEVGEGRVGAELKESAALGGRTVEWARRPAVRAATVRAGLAYLEERGVRVLRYLPNLGLAQVRLDPMLAGDLERSPLVDAIEPRGFAMLDGERVDWGVDTVHAPVAWTLSSGAGARVLVIDDGYIRGREDLPVVPLDHCAGPFDGCSAEGDSHGTTVIGVIAMIAGNGVGGVGVAPGVGAADLYVYGACGVLGPDTEGCPWDELVAGIDQGITWGVDVINMSVSGPTGTPALAEAVARAEQAGIVVVASAGNNVSAAVRFPAGYGSVIGVAGVNDAGQAVAHQGDARGCIGFSGSGPGVAISAPFYAVTTVGPTGYTRRCGTSFSAPFVAGAAAIIRSLDPGISAEQVRLVLLHTAVDHGEPGWDPSYGYGVLDIAAAVAAARDRGPERSPRPRTRDTAGEPGPGAGAH